MKTTTKEVLYQEFLNACEALYLEGFYNGVEIEWVFFKDLFGLVFFRALRFLLLKIFNGTTQKVLLAWRKLKWHYGNEIDCKSVLADLEEVRKNARNSADRLKWQKVHFMRSLGVDENENKEEVNNETKELLQALSLRD